MEEATRRATTVTVDRTVLDAAEARGIDLDETLERALTDKLRSQAVSEWLHENEKGFQAWNDYVDRDGVPLAHYRKF